MPLLEDACVYSYLLRQHVIEILTYAATLILLLQVTEIHNFSQDDLMTEDIFILDCHSAIFVWVGQQVDSKMKMHALTIGEVWFSLRHKGGILFRFPCIFTSCSAQVFSSIIESHCCENNF